MTAAGPTNSGTHPRELGPPVGAEPSRFRLLGEGHCPTALLALEADLDVVAQAASGAEALAMARAHTPDVAILDLQMPRS
ncbi:MAG: two component transcriptional regulator, LuxR family [Blastococcus sp.]|nr:two component transcriptional regulator, LuxR family [Blastococcus sp.]